MISNGKKTDTTIWGYLTLLLPISFGVVAALESWHLFIAVGAVVGMGWGWRYYQRHQQKQLAQLNAVFYRLIQENQGRMTTLDLAMAAKISGNVVQQYLEERAKEFAAHYEITEQGGIIYYFETALPGNSPTPSSSTPKSVDLFPLGTAKKVHNSPTPLTQAELARRFQVHPTTVSKWKLKAEFAQWSSQKDPEAVTWKYSEETKRFYPVN